MTLHWSERALKDLDAMYIGVYEACRDFETADRYYDEFIAKVESKRHVPRSGSRLFIGGYWTGDFYIVYKEYVAFYRVREERMEISRVELRSADHVRRFIRGE